MTVKHTLISLDMRVFALCSLMELHRSKTADRNHSMPKRATVLYTVALFSVGTLCAIPLKMRGSKS